MVFDHVVAIAEPRAGNARTGPRRPAWKRELTCPNANMNAILTSVRSDASVLSRLAEVETRLQALERQDLHRSSSTDVISQLPQPRQDLETVAGAPRPPNIHTAAGARLPAGWPRIRLNLTLPGVTYPDYLASCDAAEPLLSRQVSHAIEIPRLPLWQVKRLLDFFYAAVHQLPVYLEDLISHTPSLQYDHISEYFVALQSSPSTYTQADAIDTAELPIPQLLVLSIAAWAANGILGDMEFPDLGTVSTTCFSLALQKQWTLHSGSEANELLVPMSLTLVGGLLSIWARPFHALGILQSIDPAIRQLSLRHHGNS
jgi:hypothetical protein